MIKKKYKVSLIGAGKIAHSLIPALIKGSFEITSVISRNIKSAKILASKNNIKSYSDSLLSIPSNTELIIIAVPDDEINNVADELNGLEFRLKNKIVFHLSGSKSSIVLKELAEKGIYTASLHIMQTFSSHEVVSIKKSYCAIETDQDLCFEQLKGICKSLELKSFRIDHKQKILYHLMGTMASNFLVEKFYNIEKCAQAMPNDFPSSSDLLSSLIDQTLNNIKKNGAVESLSGPVERGDINTIKAHLEAIEDDLDFTLSYAAISLNLINTAIIKGSISESTGSELREFLKYKIREISHL